RGKLVVLAHGCILSRNAASSKPGSIHYARSRHLDRWLLVDSTYERRSITAHDYTSLPCDPAEGLQNAGLVARITQWLEKTS
ncbi:hypothetical protein, partial [Yanghanlia caeni]|nr:hypothetical protein [Alcaligenaceae bacterium LG-2]